VTIEIMDRAGAWAYRICPTDPAVIERRINQHGARWYFYLRRDTPNEAKAALLAIVRTEV